MKLTLLTALLLMSCEMQNSREPVIDYRCSEKQLDLVKKEVAICSETSFYTSFCFTQAKTTICDKIEVQK